MDVVLPAVALTIALAIVLVALLLVRVARGWRRTAENRVAAAVAEMTARMESLVGELGEALERAETRVRRAQRLTDVAASLELDDVFERTLDATRAIARADAAIVSLPTGPDGRPLVATLGLSREEADLQVPLSGPPDGRDARAISISYRYTADVLEREDSVIHGGIAVPLAAAGETIGHLAVFTRASDAVFGDDALEELEEIALRAGPAIANALRFRDARTLADLDALTGLHNRRYFHDMLAREVARAQRYSRRLALVVFDLDDFKDVNDRIGHLEGDAVLAEAAERIGDVVRSADIACRVGGDEFGVILPESTYADAERLSRRVQRSMSGQPAGEAGTLSVSAGVAELTTGDDARSFFRRADAALYRAKDAGKGRVVIAAGTGPASDADPPRAPPPTNIADQARGRGRPSA